MIEKKEIVSKASAVIKPTLWYTNSILDDADFATAIEIDKLSILINKTEKLKEEAWSIDREIASILDDISKRSKCSKQAESETKEQSS